MEHSQVEQTYWWDTSEAFEPPVTEFPAKADVVVVGAGFTGVAAARELASRGASVAVFDRGALGRGASTRNGGMTIATNFKHTGQTLVKHYGQSLGRQLFEVSIQANQFVEDLIERERLDCDYARFGHLFAAFKLRDYHTLEREVEFLDKHFGYRAKVVARNELEQELGSSLYQGALVDEHSGGLHPAKYFAGLAGLASRAGAALFPHTDVKAVERVDGGFAVHTARGKVRAREVLVATDGYTDDTFPEFRRRIISVGSYVVVTEKLAPEALSRLIPHNRMVVDTKYLLYYYRQTPDGRLFFGGRVSFAPTTVEHSRHWLRAAMARVFPELASVRLDYAWMGNVGFTFDLWPHLGRNADGLYYALGFCGHGVAMGTYLGSKIGAHIASDEAPLTPLAKLAFPSRFYYRGNPWFLQFSGWWFRLLDSLP